MTSPFPGGSDGKKSACYAGDPGSIPGSGRSPGEGQRTPVFLPEYRRAWQAAVHGAAESGATEQLTARTLDFYQATSGVSGITHSC